MSPLCLFPPTHIVIDWSDTCTTVYALATELELNLEYKPTLTHSFVRLIHEKKLLLACFTQNLDALERRAGVPESKLIEAHGNFATHRCSNCRSEYDLELMIDAIKRGEMLVCANCDDSDDSYEGIIPNNIAVFKKDVSIFAWYCFPTCFLAY